MSINNKLQTKNWRRVIGLAILIPSLLMTGLPQLAQAQTPTVSPTPTAEPTPTPEPTETPRDGSRNGSTWNPSEPVLELEVPDCPGVVRSIDASKLPPSIYPKPSCTVTGGGDTGGDVTHGKYGTDLGSPAAGTQFWLITGGKVHELSQGYGMTNYALGKPRNDAGELIYAYCADYGISQGDAPGHCGVDISAALGEQLFSPVSGKVVCAGTGVPLDAGKEKCVAFSSDSSSGPRSGRLQIELQNGDQLIIGHMSRIDVAPGATVSPGQPIGLVGTAGTGSHLHLEYRHQDDGKTITYDPRDMFDRPAPSTTEAMTTSQSPLALRPTPASDSQVAADVDTSGTMEAFITKYGFFPATDKSNRDFSDTVNFGIMRDLAIKYTQAPLDPEMVVWWAWSENAFDPDTGMHDSYNYTNCGDTTYEVDVNCSIHNKQGVISWQLGFGQQFAGATNGPVLIEAFQKTHGDPNNATLVQQVGQNVLTKSNISKTFPNRTVANILGGGSNIVATPDNYWIYTLGRDPAISTYLLAKALASEALPGNGKTYYDVVMGWGGYSDADWQVYSNTMNDVIINWGLVPGGDSVSCSSSGTGANGSCSTITDSYNGLTLEQFTEAINKNLSAYKEIAACADVPWQMMAAIHLRETRLDAGYHLPGLDGALGPWQIAPTSSLWGKVDPFNFVDAGCAVAKAELQGKVRNGPLTKDMNPADHQNEISIKDGFFGYNGRAGWEPNEAKGCTPNTDGNDDWDFDCSAYVMNNWDENHRNMVIVGAGGKEYPQPDNDGAWKVFFKLYYSTYGADGSMLVYGGLCNYGTGVVNGIALPTKSGVRITSHFFEPYSNGQPHKGIDIGNAEGDPVFAMADGEIITSAWSVNGGYYVMQLVKAGTAGNSADRYIYYGHLSPQGMAAKGSVVKAGLQIGKTGSKMVERDGKLVENGRGITGAHLHFGIWISSTEPTAKDGHITPCSLDQFKQGYPDLACDTWGGGLTW